MPEQENNTNDDLISIEGVLKPALVREYENETSPNASLLSAKCIAVYGCPSYGKSFSALPSVIGMIGNVSSNTAILILVGENDSLTPLNQALLMQQRLTEVNHPGPSNYCLSKSWTFICSFQSMDRLTWPNGRICISGFV